jgi:hypothetical protein
MIRTLTAYTNEIDDAEAAVSEILGQLALEEHLLGNTVGLLTCYSDFVESEAVKAVCRALPFEVVGSTTLGNLVPGSGDGDTMLLTLMVLTSDDVSFSVGLTAPLPSEDETPLSEAYADAKAKLAGEPALMISFAPLLQNVGGDFYANAFTKITGGVPNFGMIAVDNNSDYHQACVIHNGEAYSGRYAFVLLAGSVRPRFFMCSVSPEKIFQTKGIVTASRGNQLQTVNNMPIVSYLETLGLAKNEDGTIVGINSFPFIVDYNDGTEPVVRAVFALTPEGYAVCGGDIPVNAILTVGSFDAESVVSTTAATILSAFASEKPDCALMFSCVGRYFALGYNTTDEIDRVRALMKEFAVPYQFTYSGGELCPVHSQNDDPALTNRNHNDTFVMCCM